MDDQDPVAVEAVHAIRAGDTNALRNLLSQHPGLACEQIHGTRTPLHVAADWPGYFHSASTGWSRCTWTRASAQMMASTEPSGSGSWSSAATWNAPWGTRRRAWASMPGELSTPIT